MLTQKQQRICDQYSARDANGKVHCLECPLVVDAENLMCRAFCHYDRTQRKWVPDEEEVCNK